MQIARTNCEAVLSSYLLLIALSVQDARAGSSERVATKHLDVARKLSDGLRACWFRTAPAVCRAFANYADVNRAISDAQKAAINRAVADDPDL